MKPHQQTRVNILLGKETDTRGVGYNLNQSKIAIGAGGFAGKGYLHGTQTKLDYVPEQSTDFIFCTVGEEWGFLGTMAVILLFSSLLIRLLYLAERQRSVFARLYGYGMVSILFFHIAINIAMTIGLFPVIGIPLPFFSYGGSSMLAFTLLLFVFIRLDAVRKIYLK
jgi:rod shape determining protein RodA